MNEIYKIDKKLVHREKKTKNTRNEVENIQFNTLWSHLVFPTSLLCIRFYAMIQNLTAENCLREDS